MDDKKCSLTQDEIIKFHEVITISESISKNGLDNIKIDGKLTKKFKKLNGIELVRRKEFEVVEHKEVNKLLYTKSRKSLAASFIAHIRNAYTHSQISIDGDYFVIKDYKFISENKKVGGKTMTAYGRIHRDFLFPLIDCIIKDNNINI